MNVQQKEIIEHVLSFDVIIKGNMHTLNSLKHKLMMSHVNNTID